MSLYLYFVILYFVFNNTVQLCMWQKVYSSTAGNSLKDFHKPHSEIRQSRDNLNILVSQAANTLALPAKDLHFVRCAPVLFDFLTATFISRIFMPFVTWTACCHSDKSPLLWGRSRSAATTAAYQRCSAVFLSIHEASQVDSSHWKSWVAAQSCWTPCLPALSADKPV